LWPFEAEMVKQGPQRVMLERAKSHSTVGGPRDAEYGPGHCQHTLETAIYPKKNFVSKFCLPCLHSSSSPGGSHRTRFGTLACWKNKNKIHKLDLKLINKNQIKKWQ
jgi:hypothetical protein